MLGSDLEIIPREGGGEQDQLEKWRLDRDRGPQPAPWEAQDLKWPRPVWSQVGQALLVLPPTDMKLGLLPEAGSLAVGGSPWLGPPLRNQQRERVDGPYA